MGGNEPILNNFSFGSAATNAVQRNENKSLPSLISADEAVIGAFERNYGIDQVSINSFTGTVVVTTPDNFDYQAAADRVDRLGVNLHSELNEGVLAWLQGPHPETAFQQAV